MSKNEWTANITYKLLSEGHDSGLISTEEAQKAFSFYNTYLTMGCVDSLNTAAWLARQHWAHCASSPKTFQLGA